MTQAARCIVDVVISLSTDDSISSQIPFPERRIRLSRENPSVVIGRASRVLSKGLVAAVNNGWFDSPVMSRNHAEIVANFDVKSVQIRDIGSLHGTFVNHQDDRIPLNSLQNIQDGDDIRFGTRIWRGSEKFAPTTVKIEISFSNDTEGQSSAAPFIVEVPDMSDDESVGELPPATGPSQGFDGTIELDGEIELQQSNLHTLIDLTSPPRTLTPAAAALSGSFKATVDTLPEDSSESSIYLSTGEEDNDDALEAELETGQPCDLENDGTGSKILRNKRIPVDPDASEIPVGVESCSAAYAWTEDPEGGLVLPPIRTLTETDIVASGIGSENFVKLPPLAKDKSNLAELSHPGVLFDEPPLCSSPLAEAGERFLNAPLPSTPPHEDVLGFFQDEMGSAYLFNQYKRANGTTPLPPEEAVDGYQRTHVSISDIVDNGATKASDIKTMRKRKAAHISSESPREVLWASQQTRSSPRLDPNSTDELMPLTPATASAPSMEIGISTTSALAFTVPSENAINTVMSASAISERSRPHKRLRRIAERVGYAALGGATVGAMVLGSLIYTAPSFA